MQVTVDPRIGAPLELDPRPDRRARLIAALAVLGAVCLLGTQFWTPRPTSPAIDATRAEVVAALDLLLPGLHQGNVSAPASGPALAELDRVVRELVLTETFVRVKIWNRDGQVVYSDDGTLVGERFEIGHELAEALAGTVAVEAMTTTRIATPDRTQRLHEVYVPIVLPGDVAPSGAFEVYAYADESATRLTDWVAGAAAVGLLAAATLLWTRGRYRP